MNTRETWLLTSLAVVGSILVLGLFHASVSKGLSYLFWRPVSVLSALRDACWAGMAEVRALDQRLRVAEQMDGPSIILQRLFGSVLYAAVFAVALATDLEFFSAFVKSVGFGVGQLPLPVSLGTLIAFGTIGGATVWGTVLFDLLEKTHLMPYRPRTPWLSRIMWVLTLVSLLLLFAIVVATAVDRWLVVTTPTAAAAMPAATGAGTSVAAIAAAAPGAATFPPSESWISLVVLLSHGVLILLTTLVTWDGFLWLFVIGGWLVLRLLVSVLWLAGLPFHLLQLVWSSVGEVVLSFVEVPLRACERLTAPLGRLLGTAFVDTGTRISLVDDPRRRTTDRSAAGDAPSDATSEAAETGEGGPAEDGSDRDTSDSPDPQRSRNWDPYGPKHD